MGRIENVSIRGFEASYLDNEERLTILDPIRENVRDYPESNALGDMPSYGFFIRHADGIVLEGISIEPRSMNTRPMIVTDDADVKEE